MVDIQIDKDFPKDIYIHHEGRYIDVLAELAWANIYMAKTLAEEHKLNPKELLKNILEVSLENMEEEKNVL